MSTLFSRSADPTDYSTPPYRPVAAWYAYPDSEEGWRDLYDQRWQSYLLYPYSVAAQQGEHLFRAFDDSGNEIDQTRRVYRYGAFICDIDAAALFGPTGLTLELEKGAAAELLTAGEVVWRRSKLALHLPLFGRMLCVLGDRFWEATRLGTERPYRATLVDHDPRTVSVTYDDTGKTIVEARICVDYMERQKRGPGTISEVVNRYERILTPTEVRVELNGTPVLGESGPHLAGVVPLTHAKCIPFDQPEHSLNASFGIERAVMHLDSNATQIKAVGVRYGNPTLVLAGMRVGANSDVQKFGRMIDGAPTDATASYLELKGEAIPPMLEAARELHTHIRDTSPEFLFASDAANESAEARSLRGQAFESKIGQMRSQVFAALCEATGIAAAMDAGRAYDGDAPGFRIDAGPILPRNIKAELDGMELAKGDMTKADRVRHLQRLGLIDKNADPVQYAAEVADETAARATAFFTEPPVK